jgi:hypothetical protein
MVWSPGGAKGSIRVMVVWRRVWHDPVSAHPQRADGDSVRQCGREGQAGPEALQQVPCCPRRRRRAGASVGPAASGADGRDAEPPCAAARAVAVS